MQLATYKYIAEMEDAHWWYRGRSRIINFFIKKYVTKTECSTAIIGCGTGATVKIWKKFSNELIGVDTSEDALRLSAGKGFTSLIQDDAQTLSSLPQSHFDVVAILDVLEHIEDDKAGIQALNRILKSNSILMITVPAKQYLWGGADILSFHKRRYEAKDLLEKLRNANFEILDYTHFNTLLFLPIYFVRKLEHLFNLKPELEYRIPNPFLNALLYSIFVVELLLLQFLRLPIGVSFLVVAKKTTSSQ